MDIIRITLLTVILLFARMDQGIEMAMIPRDVSHINWSEQFPELQSINSHIAAKSKQAIPSIIRSHDQFSIGDDMENPQTRFPLPGPIPIDTEDLKKIAQILAILGEQILPAIINPLNTEGETKSNGKGQNEETNH